jgi:sialate O-acetylesterase
MNGAKVRDQQRKALALSERTGMVVVSDIGNLQNIHPGNKQEAGKRLAAWALHYDYGRSELSFSGPLLTSWELEKNRIFLHFDYTDNGLISSDGELREFEVLDPSGRWVEAKAYIRGNLVEVEVSIEEPRGIRYAFRNDSQPNLFNGAGLPASCFEELFYP